MNLNEYQVAATKTAEYPMLGSNLIYPALGLAGESGEVVDKIKKLWRNKGQTSGHELSQDDRIALAKEIGDTLWYVAALANELGYPLSDIARMNIEKLTDRKARGVVKSEGDNR